MVVINPHRMLSVTVARPKFNALVAEDHNGGQMTHIVSGGQLVAHIVPPNAWMIDDQLVLDFMLAAIIEKEATWGSGAEQWRDGTFEHAGDVIGRVLGWAWPTDPDAIFLRALADYVAALSRSSGAPPRSTTCVSASPELSAAGPWDAP
jgi:hypothetical protein